jgi:hypothetical protein
MTVLLYDVYRILVTICTELLYCLLTRRRHVSYECCATSKHWHGCRATLLLTTGLVCSSLEGNAAPEYLFLNSGAQDKFMNKNLTYFHQSVITEFISRINKSNMSWRGVIYAPLYTSFIFHVAVWIFSRDWVTIDRFGIGNLIYWTLTEINYK